jgi:hypothetical protein
VIVAITPVFGSLARGSGEQPWFEHTMGLMSNGRPSLCAAGMADVWRTYSVSGVRASSLRSIRCAPKQAFAWSVPQDLSPAGSIDVIGFEDPRFEQLTDHRRWPAEYQIG